MAISSGVYSKPRQCEASITNLAKKLCNYRQFRHLQFTCVNYFLICTCFVPSLSGTNAGNSPIYDVSGFSWMRFARISQPKILLPKTINHRDACNESCYKIIRFCGSWERKKHALAEIAEGVLTSIDYCTHLVNIKVILVMIWVSTNFCSPASFSISKILCIKC